MHIVVNKSKQGKKIFNSTLLMESYREDGKVKKRTVANLSKCSEAEIAAMRLALTHKGNLKSLESISTVKLKNGRSIGATWCVYQVAKELGIQSALGNDANGKMALWQVIARVINQGSRLSCVRMAESYSAGEVLGIQEGFTEDHLYKNLRWISENQTKFEDKLWKHRKKKSLGLFLYDVTSSYLEGENNELAAYGYNRDGKKGKKQVVAGLLCDEEGIPVSIELFHGNTNDVKTFGVQIQKVAERFGCAEVTFVGDKGMIKQAGIDALKTEGFHYITTITKPQIESLIKLDVLQLGLFDNALCEIEDNGMRYIFRRNPLRAKEMEACRLEKKMSIERLIMKQNVYLAEHPKAKEETAQKAVKEKIKTFHLESWLSIRIVKRKIELTENTEGRTEMNKLDGCYVMKTDLPNTIDKKTIHDRYKDLAEVELAFRTCKTGLLELRPIYTRTEANTRGHAFVVMLAYMIIQRLKKAWESFDLTVEEGIDHLSKILSCEVWMNDSHMASKITIPESETQRLLDSLGIVMPQVLPKSEAKIVTRKKLQTRRKTFLESGV